MQSLKTRAPLWVWAIVITLLITIPVLATLHFIGIINLSFLSDLALGYMMWGSVNIVNFFIALILPILFGVAIGYAYVNYVKGMKLGKNTTYQGATTALQTAPIQTNAFTTPTPAPIIQQTEQEKN